MLYLVPLVAFLGCIAGALLKQWIPEELKKGATYFVWLEKILLVILCVSLLSIAFTNSMMSYVFFVLGIAATFIVKEPYLYFGFALSGLDFFAAVVVFLFGIPYGEKKSIVKNALLFATPFLLLLWPVNVHQLLLFAAGASLALVFRYKT